MNRARFKMKQKSQIKCSECGTTDFVRTRGIDGKGEYEKLRYVKDLETGGIICGLCLEIKQGIPG